MELADFLARKEIHLSDIVEQAKEALHLAPGDVLFTCGSLVEGLGNEKSDLDLILITDRQDIPFTSLSDVALVVGQCIIDIHVAQLTKVEELLGRFNNWAAQPRQPRLTKGFTITDRKLLHRLLSGRALYGADEFLRLQKRVPRADLSRYKLDWACYFASTIQVDLAGLLSAGDQHSMPFAAQELLGHVADALLAGYGYTNPGRQWRVRQLAELPEEWETGLPGRPTGMSARELYVSLHRAPQSVTPAAAFDHALRIVAFSRRVLPAMECCLLTLSMPQLPSPCADDKADGRPLPHLDLEVAVRYKVGHFELLRLNERGQVFSLSPQEYSLLCLFDGETSAEHAINYAQRLWGNVNGRALVDEMLALIRYGELEARAFPDEEALSTILRRDSA